MAIELADLKMFKSATVSDAGANGGRMSASEVVSGAIANLFAPVEDAERTAGSVKYRKFFQKVHEDGSDSLYSGQVFMERDTDGEDAFSIFPGTQTDTQAGITGSERRYAVGKLLSNVSGGASVIVLEVADGNEGTFVPGDAVRITDKTSLDDEGGNTEFRVIDAVDTLSPGNLVEVTLTQALDNAYLASVTRAMALYEPGTVVASYDDFVVTSAGSGDYDPDEISLNNRGAIEQTWTITFSSSTNFAIAGDTVGSAGSGTVGGGAAPNNPDWTKPYFTLDAAGFSGTWTAGDTIVFSTSPAAVPMWAKRVVPADAAAAGANSAAVRLRGQRA